MAEKEYIEREAAIKRFTFAVLDCLGMEPTIRAVDIIKALKSIPAADVRPVKRGKWEEDCAGAAICSVCNEYAFETSTHHLCGWFPNFCPNCGADMRPEPPKEET